MKKVPEQSGKALVLCPTTPAISAQKFRKLRYPTLLNFQNEWLCYDGSAYAPLEDATIAARIKEFLFGTKKTVIENDKKVLVPFNPTPKHVNDVYAMLEHDCHVPHNTMSPPKWLDGGKGVYAGLDEKNIISCQNGLLDIETRKLYPATDKFFTRTALPIDYDPTAPEPLLWDAFLHQVTNNRQPLVDLLQEMIGYLISTDTSMQKLFFLWGRPGGGKGTILRIVAALIGSHNTRFPAIETLAGRFGYQSLIGASLAQITDMDTDNGQALGTAATRLNAISGEDGITAERKNLTDWHGKLGVRFLLAGNGLPNFGSHMGAMSRRLLIVPFDISFEGKEDADLTAKLLDELPGILNFALDGLARLRERGKFFEPSDSAAAKHRMIFQSDPLHGMIEQHCTLSGGVDKDVIYNLMQNYCKATGSKCPPLNKFSENLLRAFPSISASKRNSVRGSNENRVPCYRGIRLNDATAAKVYKRDPDLAVPGPRYDLLKDECGWPIVRAGAEVN